MKSKGLISIIIFSILSLIYSCEIRDPYINVTEVIIDKRFVVMVEGSVEKLTAVVNPSSAANKNINWTSSDESVVTVDKNGLLTSHNMGVATVTATTEDGKKKLLVILL